MKKRIFTSINIILLFILVIFNISSIYRFGFDNDSIFLLILSFLCLVVCILGALFPSKIVKLIHALSSKLYKNSREINIPSEIEAKRIFLGRLMYILLISNILLFLSLLSYLL